MNPHHLWLAAEKAADRNDLNAADSLYSQALAVDEVHVPSLIGLSAVRTRLNRHRAAHELAMRASSVGTQQVPIAYGLAQRLRYFHEFQAMDTALAVPGFAEQAPPLIVAKAAVMLSSIGAHEHALAMATAALERHPRHAPLLFVRGNLHFFDGELESAEACYERSLGCDPHLLQNSWMLSSVRTQTASRNHLDRIRRQRAAAQPGGQGEVYACFALHKELHDIGDYHGAWEALMRGCSVKRRHVEHDGRAATDLIAAIKLTCSRDFLAAQASAQLTSTPIFIVGMHRSGTTLLERILSGHASINDAGETCAFDAQMHLAVDQTTLHRNSAQIASKAASADFERIAQGYQRQIAWLSKGRPFFTEKLPSNFWNVGFICKALPQARILHVVRDPMATCFSNLRTLFSGVATYSYDQNELGSFFNTYREMMAFWHDALPNSVLDVRYDDLVNDPEREILRIAAHCGFEAQPQMLDVRRASGRVSTASAGSARDGIQRNRSEVWKHYEEHLSPLQRKIDRIAARQ